MTVFACGSCEGFKAGYHAAIALLVAGAAVYNAVAWLQRRERHLAINVGLDVALVAWELRLCASHRPGAPGRA